MALGQKRPESHPKTQNIFCDQWAKRSRKLEPWTLAYGCNGTVNAPANINIDIDIHPWTYLDVDNIWSIAAKALMTTRRDVLEDNRSSISLDE